MRIGWELGELLHALRGVEVRADAWNKEQLATETDERQAADGVPALIAILTDQLHQVRRAYEGWLDPRELLNERNADGLSADESEAVLLHPWSLDERLKRFSDEQARVRRQLARHRGEGEEG